MYINDVHIAYYVGVAILGLFMGLFTDWAIKRLSKKKTVLFLDFFKKYLKEFRPNYIIMFVTVIIYVLLIYVHGFGTTIVSNLDLVKYFLLTPMLLIALVIDFKQQIIPNRLTLTMFELGLLFTFLYGLSNIAISINMILGMFAGAGIFLGITLIGGALFGKEAMGFGDVKIMGALGLLFGLSNIIIITLISFLVGAILSIILLITKIKKSDEYIPFGPFIVIATFVSMYIPFETLKNALMTIFTLGMYK